MVNVNMEKRMHWLRVGQGTEHPIENEIGNSLRGMVEQAEEEKYVLIGEWYYYLYAHGQQTDLCRTRGRIGEPSLTEVIKPGPYAISEEDVERAVNYWSCGSFESGHYRISPLIERKLRILFE
jgi:hypothetical protein